MAVAESHERNRSRIGGVKTRILAMLAALVVAFKTATTLLKAGHSQAEVRAELAQRMNLQGAVVTVVVAGATAFAGISVMSSIGGTLALSQGDMFYNSSEALQDGINQFFTNLPTVFVVIALVLIVGYLTILR
jgi:malonyl CoA-acyl carrier protein transacylase